MAGSFEMPEKEIFKYRLEDRRIVQVLHKLKRKARQRSIRFLQLYREGKKKSNYKNTYVMVRSAVWELAAQLIEKEMEGYRIEN